MTASDESFLNELRAAFAVEAEEHVQAVSAGLLDLEKRDDASQRAATFEAVYREAHSLKGAARAVNFTDIESVCQSL